VTLTGDRQPGSGAQCRMGWKLLLQVMFGDEISRITNELVWIVTDRELDGLISHSKWSRI
jgi:hypothetical protein